MRRRGARWRPAWRSGIVALAALVALAACVPWSSDATPSAAPVARPPGSRATATPLAPRRGGRVTIGIAGELRDLTPSLDGNALAAALFRPVVEGLFAFDGEGRPQPWLAESVPAHGKGIADDGLVVIIRLRQGVAWEDGRALTGDDLRFSHAMALDRANRLPPGVVAANEAITTLDVLDPFTVRLGYADPEAATADATGFLHAFPLILPAHLFNGQTTLAGHPYGRAPFGTGPFRFREWVPGDRLILVRSASYRDGGRPYLDEIVYRQFPELAAAEAARQAGEIDLVLAPDGAAFVGPVPGALRGVGAVPMRGAQEWWRER